MTLTKCCGCCSLKTGTITIGATGIALSLILLILIVAVIADPRAIQTDSEKAIWTSHIVGNSISIGISTLLIIGALKKNTCLMLPWLILGVIGIVGLCIGFFIASMTIFIHGTVFNGFLCLICGLSSVAIQTYLWMVVNNYRKEILIEKMNIRMGSDGNPHNYQQVAGKE